MSTDPPFRSSSSSEPGAGAGGARLPRTLGRYEVIAGLARGGMASVYLGRIRGASGFSRVVALKVCAPILRDDPELVTMFLDEARLTAKFRHPNVVATLDVEHADELFLVMDYVEGDSLNGLLRSMVDRREHVPVPIVLRLALDALAGLEAAHQLRDDATGEPLAIVHRDVSPHNLLVGVDGITRVADFGVASSLVRAAVTRSGQFRGKLGYSAPEQLSAEPVSPRTDVFAMGVVLWETLTRRRLFTGPSDAAILNQVLHREIPAPSELRPEVPAALDAAVLGALARDPAQRHPSAVALARALEECGVPPASPAQVAAWIETVHAEALAARRALLRDASRAPSVPRLRTVPVAERATVPLRVATDELAGPVRTPTPTSTGPRRRRVRSLVAGLAVVAATLLALVIARSGAPTSDRAEAELAAPAPSAAAAPAPAPAPAVVTELPVPAPAPAPAEPAPAPVVETAPAPPPPPRRTRVRRKPPRREPAVTAPGEEFPGTI